MVPPAYRGRVPFAALLLCAAFTSYATAAAAAPVRQENFPAYIKAEHRTVILNWLKLRPYLRVATEDDVENKELFESMKQNYTGKYVHAFYAYADFNNDGREDFAVGLVNKRRQGALAVALFNGPFGRGRLPGPAFYDQSRFHLDDYFYLVGDKWNELQIGVGNDMRTVLLKRRGRRYYIWEGATQ